MDWKTQLDRLVKDYLPDMKMAHDEPMSRHTSFRVGGPAARMAFPANGEQVVLLQGFAEECGIEPLVIGNGTNLLVADEGLDRLVIDTSEAMHSICLEEDGVTITADAGVSLARLADFACKQGLTGLEFAHGIPGTLGGAVCMNAGAYGGEMQQVIDHVTLLFPEEGIRTLTCEEMKFSYRRSLLNEFPNAIVLKASVQLSAGDPESIRETMRDLMQRRKNSQPLEWPSAGSTFKRPEGYFAAALIDQCGLKGFTVGGAQVSEKHAGFVINRGGATFADIMELIAQVQERVYKEKGVRLEPEIKVIQS